MRRHVHVITPGDHFSPRTGSAVPTVVHGLSEATPVHAPRPAVAVARGTYPERYTSAEVLEYEQAAAQRADRYVDAALSRLGLPRLASRRTFASTVSDQRSWHAAIVLAHNAPQLVPSVDTRLHMPVLYAHNNVLRTYSQREAGRTLDRAPVLVCVSEALATQIAPHLPARLRSRIAVVRNGVDAATFRRPGRIGRTGPLKVMFVGRMIRDKGADVLVEAVRRLNRDDIHLTLVGASGFAADAPLTSFETSVRRAVSPMGGRATLRTFVPRAEVAATLQQADVVVVPSRWPDPCPLTVLEGMAAGNAVVGSNIGGIPESLRDAGILVPPGDPDALASALAALVDDDALLERTALACQAYAEAHDWASAARRLHDALAPHA
jgi:glycosyltransferase involved in cell wall biosynthesis